MAAELLGIIPGRLCFDRGMRETPGVSLCDRDRPEVKDPRRDPKAVVSSHGKPHAVPSPEFDDEEYGDGKSFAVQAGRHIQELQRLSAFQQVTTKVSSCL